MNTPSHIILNLALLLPRQPDQAIAIVLGAILPDLPIFGLYAWARLYKGHSEGEVWGQLYWQPLWQNLTHGAHSLPIALFGVLLGHGLQNPWIQAFSYSAILHSLGDLPVHHDDAHRHFLPLSQYRFISPLSYWDPRHYGKQVAIVEQLLVLLASIGLWPLLAQTSPAIPWPQTILVLTNLLYGTALIYRLTQRSQHPQSTNNSTL